MTFQEQLAHLKQKIEGDMPQKYLDIMHGATAELETSGIQETILNVGDSAPVFALPDENEEIISCAELMANGPLIITFYRGLWCPYCNTDLGNLKHYVPIIEEASATMVAISPERPEYSQEIIKRHKLPYSILSDAGNEVAAKFGLRFTVPERLKLLYRDTFGIDLEKYNGDSTWTLPIPARFLIDTEGIIRYAEFSPDYTQRPDPDDLIGILKTL